MLLPNAENAVIDINKLRDYCLNPQNETGKHKARVFAAALGLYRRDSVFLRNAILAAVRVEDAIIGVLNRHGQRYSVDFDMTHAGKTASVRSVWIVDTRSINPRLITCFVI